MKKILLIFFLTLLTVSRAQASLVLNEIYASPPTGEAEWVEIYNNSSVPASFAGFQIAELAKDTIANPEGLSEDIIIPAYGFLRIVPSKLTLNNAGDTIYLLDPDGRVADIVAYPKLTANQSYARIPDGADSWQKTTPTPASSNNPDSSQADTVSGDSDQATTGDSPSATSSAATSSTNSHTNLSDTVTSRGQTVTSTSLTPDTGSSSATSQSSAASPSPTPTPDSKTGSGTQLTVSPSPSPSPIVVIREVDKQPDTRWKDDLNFNLPYLGTADVSARKAQVLGAATQVPHSASASAHLLGVHLSAWPLAALAAASIWCALIALWWAWLEYAGGREWLRSREPIDEF